MGHSQFKDGRSRRSRASILGVATAAALALFASVSLTSASADHSAEHGCPPLNSGLWAGAWDLPDVQGGGWSANLDFGETLTGTFNVDILGQLAPATGSVDCAVIQFGDLGGVVSVSATLSADGTSLSGIWWQIGSAPGSGGTWSGTYIGPSTTTTTEPTTTTTEPTTTTTTQPDEPTTPGSNTGPLARSSSSNIYRWNWMSYNCPASGYTFAQNWKAYTNDSSVDRIEFHYRIRYYTQSNQGPKWFTARELRGDTPTNDKVVPGKWWNWYKSWDMSEAYTYDGLRLYLQYRIKFVNDRGIFFPDSVRKDTGWRSTCSNVLDVG